MVMHPSCPTHLKYGHIVASKSSGVQETSTGILKRVAQGRELLQYSSRFDTVSTSCPRMMYAHVPTRVGINTD